MLYDLAGPVGQIVQALTFAAGGQTLGVHGQQGTIQTTAAVLTSLGYSGEFFDTAAQQQYLRARFYNPANGQFNRLDPFVGNIQDPQSLHKYAYVHGDPVNGVDPSGMFLGAMIASVIGGFVDSRDASASVPKIEATRLLVATSIGATGGSLLYLAVGKSIVRGGAYGALLGAGLYISYRKSVFHFDKISSLVGNGQLPASRIPRRLKVFYDALLSGGSAAFGSALRDIQKLYRNNLANAILDPNAEFVTRAQALNMGINAFEAFSQAVYDDATKLSIDVPWYAQLADTFLSSIVVDIANQIVEGKPVTREFLRERTLHAANLTFNSSLPMVADALNLDPATAAILPGAVATAFENFLGLGLEFLELGEAR